MHDASAAPSPWRRRALPVGAAMAGGAVLGTLFLIDPAERTVFFPCPFRLVTGLDCPLCGGLRMAHDVLHGNLIQAADHNGVALLLVPVLVVAWLRWRVLRRRGTSVRSAAPRWLSPAMAVVLVSWTVLRNIPLEPFTILRA